MDGVTYNNRKIYSLSDVAHSLKSVIEQAYVQDFYVKAEISKLNYYPHSGHCYPDLVEKVDTTVKAQMRATIWAGDYGRIRTKFVEITGTELSDGLKILCLATMNFHPAYGLSLHIRDIVPEYSLGEMAKQKQLTIQRLKEKGIYDANKQLSMALLPLCIAVVSVSTSKGYEDFQSILRASKHQVHTFLFPALLQGDGAVISISAQLKRIAAMYEHFDAVVIIRGGGGDVGLSAYDSYQLAALVATFPLPVITGIGHSTNVTVTEMVAFHAAITPTDTANFILEKVDAFIDNLHRIRETISFYALRKVDIERQRMQTIAQYIKTVTATKIHTCRYQLSASLQSIRHLSLRKINNDRHYLALTNEKIKLLDPIHILRRGYSLTLCNGKIIKKPEELKSGDTIETQLSHAVIHSTVNKIKVPAKKLKS
ncbi:exodeoxyribonuclease 7 large subunit [Bacteroidia bacterium]|nr:exodeoxyribonuclease 7 large subunit [Bacteroidia bacterium]